MFGSMRVFQRNKADADGRGGRRMTRCAATVLVLAAVAGCDGTRVRDTLPPGVRVDGYEQSTVSMVDVLVVVDNSASMTEEQENLGQNFDRFLSFLTEASVDFQIGVTTTDIVNDKGQLKSAPGQPAIITNATPNPLAAFSANVKVQSVGGNAREAGLDAARRTFELNPQGFLRPQAWLFLIFVSDEEDSSFGVPKYFYRYFAQLKGKGNEGMVQAGAIVGDTPAGCFSEQGTADPGARYAEVVELMGGRVGSICSPKFDEILREMGIDAVGLKRKFQLSKVPDLATLEVTTTLACATPASLADEICLSTANDCSAGGTLRCRVKPFEEGGKDGWSYEVGTNSVLFHGRAIPPKGSNVELMYSEPDRQTSTP